MKAFHFRLQVVLTLRQDAEEAARRVCGHAYREVVEAAARVRAAEALIAADDQRRRSRLAAGLRAAELEQGLRYSSLLQERLALAAREAALAQERLEDARAKLLRATRDREILERLRDRQRRAYDYQAARAEQKLLDELSKAAPLLAGSGLQTHSPTL